MSINKVMLATLKALTALEPKVEKTYKFERKFEELAGHIHSRPLDYKMWDQPVVYDGCSIPIRMFVPEADGYHPLIIFFHGGGWVTGSIENYTEVCLNLAKATGCMVASVDYRLAPEYKFPTAVEDCYAVTRAFFTNNLPGIDTDKITLMGASAGGNLAAAVSLMARDRGEFLPKKQVLIYPATYCDHSDASPFLSVRENGEGYLLTSSTIQTYLNLYKSSDADLRNPYFAPLMAEDFSNQPDTLVITAEFCPLRDEGEEYGKKLRRAGNYVEIVRLKGALHSFFMLPPNFEHVQQAYKAINNFLARGN